MNDLPSRVLVVGLARSGQAAALALARRGVDVVGADRVDLDGDRLAEAGVDVHLGTEDESLLEDVDLVVKSPGVPAESPLVAGARRREIPVWSELELGYRLLEHNHVLAVTGTNGKTTTSELLGAMLDTPVAGNVGRALCDLDGEVAPDQWIVCEVSSFQLEDIVEFQPKIAVLLNLEPDHLDRHASFDEYCRAKLRVFENQQGYNTAIVPRGFGEIPGEPFRIEFDGSDPLPAEPRIPGAHNRENAAAATAAARAAGLDDDAIAAALETFPGVEHRLELVAEAKGVRYVNDSKATNTAAARRAVAAYDAPLHVILGGRGKGESYSELALELKERAKRVYLIGEAANEIGIALELAGVDHQRNGDLESALEVAAKSAQPGDVVLLAPACASYDQFRDFEERGQAFKRLVAKITG